MQDVDTQIKQTLEFNTMSLVFLRRQKKNTLSFFFCSEARI